MEIRDLLSKPVWQMTGEEFIFLNRHALQGSETKPAQPAADKSLLYRVEALLYAGTIEVRPRITVIHQNFQVGVPMFFCVSG